MLTTPFGLGLLVYAVVAGAETVTPGRLHRPSETARESSQNDIASVPVRGGAFGRDEAFKRQLGYAWLLVEGSRINCPRRRL